MTPFVIENYWPGTARLLILRQEWTTYTDIETILVLINRIPAPKPVTRWQAWMMASHLSIRRPPDWRSHVADVRVLGPHAKVRTERRRRENPQTHRASTLIEVKPTTARILRRCGRKPIVKRAPTRLHSAGLSSARSSLAGRRAAKLRKLAKSTKVQKKTRHQRYYVPAAKRKDAKSKTSTTWMRSPKYIPKWFRASLEAD